MVLLLGRKFCYTITLLRNPFAAVATMASVETKKINRIVNASAYKFCEFDKEKTPEMRLKLQTEAKKNEHTLKGTLLLSTEGINVVLSGEPEPVASYKEYIDTVVAEYMVCSDEERKKNHKIEYKDSFSDRITLQKMLVKLKKEVISMGVPEINPAKDGLEQHISATDFKKWLDEDKDMLVLDTRNDYEVRVGTFEKAKDLNIKSFRDFPAEVKKQLVDVPKEKPVVMFCTGGVRCEKASYSLLNDGFKNVYQLDGGILKYFEKEGGAHYKGDCFVFDERVTVTPTLEEGHQIMCNNCGSPLNKEDQDSEFYVPDKSCMYCINGKTDFREEKKRKLN